MFRRPILLAASMLSLAAGTAPDPSTATRPVFAEVSVHDPAIIRHTDGLFYILGSHLAGAKSPDLVRWELIDAGVKDGNRLMPNVREELREALEWSQTKTLWAGSLIRLGDGKTYWYYSACKGDSPRAALGLAVADSPAGPFKHVRLLLRSGMWGQPSEDGTVYDANVHPNAVDPDVFFDATGKLWMMYGSYSGGIFILRLDPATGLPLPQQSYGKKLLGGNHSRIEAPNVLFNPTTGYYYLFLSFGGLGADGGYELRVARSKSPDGPYLDPQGNDLIACKGPQGSFFDDKAIEPFGLKLLGNHTWSADAKVEGYVSPGHNTSWRDPETGRSFLIFHTRFPGKGEGHQVRVHELAFTDTGWPLVLPLRYAPPTPSTPATPADLPGTYDVILHPRAISAAIPPATRLTLHPDGTVRGAKSGAWTLQGSALTLTLEGQTHTGIAHRQPHPATGTPTTTLTLLTPDASTMWGVLVGD